MYDNCAGDAFGDLPVIVVPGAPIVVPELAGVPGDPDANEVRAAVLDAGRWLAERSGRWAVSPGLERSRGPLSGTGTFAEFGADVHVALRPGPAVARADPSWPTSLLVAAWLRGAVAPGAELVVGDDGAADRAADGAVFDGVVFVLDGPNTLTPRAPGGHRPDDVRVFDALSASVTSSGPDPDGVRWPQWRLAARVCRGRDVRVLYRGAPFGVGYLVATAASGVPTDRAGTGERG